MQQVIQYVFACDNIMQSFMYFIGNANIFLLTYDRKVACTKFNKIKMYNKD